MIRGESGANGDCGAPGQTRAGGVNGEGGGSGADGVNGEMGMSGAEGVKGVVGLIGDEDRLTGLLIIFTMTLCHHEVLGRLMGTLISHMNDKCTPFLILTTG